MPERDPLGADEHSSLRGDKMVDVPGVRDVSLRSIDLHAPALLSRLDDGEGVESLLKGGVVSLEIFGLKVVGDVTSVDGGGESVRDGSDEVGDSLSLDDLEDAERGGRRDGRGGSLKVILGSRGSRVGWGVVRGDGHVGDWYEEGDVWV